MRGKSSAVPKTQAVKKGKIGFGGQMRTEGVFKSRFQDRKRASLEVSEALKVLICLIIS